MMRVRTAGVIVTWRRGFCPRCVLIRRAKPFPCRLRYGVHVMDRLAGLFTGVEDDAEAVLVETHDLGDFLDGEEHLAGDIGIVRRQAAMLWICFLGMTRTWDRATG